ncbi:hypothetical protein A3715_10420 [Oleiphilus sp. HI0009]|nr:hypothetical protein A3715_10420 [Oleiphilus sp. HI0009]
MSDYLDAMSVLPDQIQKEVLDNSTPEFLAQKLSDYVVELKMEIIDLKASLRTCANASTGALKQYNAQ